MQTRNISDESEVLVQLREILMRTIYDSCSSDVVSIALIALGTRLLSADALKPSVTLDQIKRDKVAAKELMR